MPTEREINNNSFSILVTNRSINCFVWRQQQKLVLILLFSSACVSPSQFDTGGIICVVSSVCDHIGISKHGQYNPPLHS